MISFSDLRPKFLVLSISDSLRCTSSPISRMFAFCRQLAERTESSSSSTDRNRFGLSGVGSSASGSADSAGSSKLMKIASCSFRIFAAKASASSGVIVPSVQISSESRSKSVSRPTRAGVTM